MPAQPEPCLVVVRRRPRRRAGRRPAQALVTLMTASAAAAGSLLAAAPARAAVPALSAMLAISATPGDPEPAGQPSTASTAAPPQTVAPATAPQTAAPATAPQASANAAAPASASPAAAPAAAAPSAAAQPPQSYLPVVGEQAARDPVGTRLIDVATPFTSGSHWLELLVTHRFIQPFNQGGTGHNLWGLDSGADVGIGFTYGVLQHLDLSVYRSAFQEDYELAAKYQFLQQEKGMPLSLAVRAGADMLGRAGVENQHRPFAQLLLGYRLAPGWNLFVSPSWVEYTPLLHNAWNAPVGITAPLPGHWLIEGEGIAANRGLRDLSGASHFAWHVAFTKPIGWHLFQILIGNSRATTVDQILGGDFAGGFTGHDLRLGFNLLRYFNL